MSIMANTTPFVTTVTKTATREKTPKEADAVPKASILEFCEEHYEDIYRSLWTGHGMTSVNFGEKPQKTPTRKNSSDSKAGNSPVRFRHERSTTRGRERLDDKNVFNRLSRRRKSVHERLSDTYSLSITKSGPSRASSRDLPSSKGRSPSRDHPRVRDCLRGVEESYDDSYSSHGSRTKYRDRSRDKDHSRSEKRQRESESPSSCGSESSTSNRRHW
ncbi:hypothetical protein Tco_1356405, partial [Tanacetum coccineum]